MFLVGMYQVSMSFKKTRAVILTKYFYAALPLKFKLLCHYMLS